MVHDGCKSKWCLMMIRANQSRIFWQNFAQAVGSFAGSLQQSGGDSETLDSDLEPFVDPNFPQIVFRGTGPLSRSTCSMGSPENKRERLMTDQQQCEIENIAPVQPTEIEHLYGFLEGKLIKHQLCEHINPGHTEHGFCANCFQTSLSSSSWYIQGLLIKPLAQWFTKVRVVIYIFQWFMHGS